MLSASRPQFVRNLSASRAPQLLVVGALHAVWSVFDEQSTDGYLPGYSFETMDEEIGLPGFCAALAGVGWLAMDSERGLQMPDFEDHNGASAKRRAQEADRKRAVRNRADHVRETSASDADKKRTREEKRREDLSITPNGVIGPSALPKAIPNVDHESVVEAYHRILPDHPRIADWTDKRQALLRKRWREFAIREEKQGKPWACTADGVQRFSDFFSFVADSKFLTGRSRPSGDRPPFVADLEWLLLPSNFLKVVEGKYHNQES